jgi:hypothetical protein
MQKPKTDPEVARQRRIAQEERRRTAQQNAQSLTTDYSSVYRRQSVFQ